MKTPTPCHGCGFGWVGVWVAWEYPRVTRGNPYFQTLFKDVQNQKGLISAMYSNGPLTPSLVDKE